MKNIIKLVIILGGCVCMGYGQVGINTSSPKQEATLDVNGNVIVKYPNEIEKKSEYSFLFTNTPTGEVKQSSDLEKPIFYLNIRLKCRKNNSPVKWESYIKSINLSIPTTETPNNSSGYFAFITQSTLRRVRDNIPAFITHSSNDSYYNPIKQVYLEDKNNWWYLHADYPSGTMVSNGIDEESKGYYWDVYIMVIDKRHVKHISVKNPDGTPGYFTTNNQAIATANDFVRDELNKTIPQKIKVLPEINQTHTSTGLVGIMTTTPTVELDVNGKLFIKKPKQANIRELYPLVWDKKKQTLSALSAYNKPFTFISGEIDTYANTTLGFEDYIADFDTRIPVSTHTLIPVMSVLKNKAYKSGNGKAMGITHGINTPEKGKKELGNPQESIAVSKKTHNGETTWHYAADYHGASAICGNLSSGTKHWRLSGIKSDENRRSFYWKYEWVAISNIFVDNLGTLFYEVQTEESDVIPVPRGDKNLIKYMLDQEKKNPGEIHKL